MNKFAHRDYPITPEDVPVVRAHKLELVRDLIVDGWAGSEISEMTGIPRRTIYNWRDRYGWPAFATRSPLAAKVDRSQASKCKHRARRAEAKTLMDMGHSRTEACRLMSIPYSTLSRLIGLWGLQWPRQTRKRMPTSCDRCKMRHKCTPERCYYEVDIVIDGLPESRLWSRQGGQQAIQRHYDGSVSTGGRPEPGQ